MRPGSTLFAPRFRPRSPPATGQAEPATGRPATGHGARTGDVLTRIAMQRADVYPAREATCTTMGEPIDTHRCIMRPRSPTRGPCSSVARSSRSSMGFNGGLMQASGRRLGNAPGPWSPPGFGGNAPSFPGACGPKPTKMHSGAHTCTMTDCTFILYQIYEYILIYYHRTRYRGDGRSYRIVRMINNAMRIGRLWNLKGSSIHCWHTRCAR